MKKLKYLLFLFLLIPFNVNADVVDWRFWGMQGTSGSVKNTYFVKDEINDYPRDYVLFNGTERFFSYSYCGTGRLDFSFPTDIQGVTSLVGYSTGGSCKVQGWDGYVYSVYFVAKNVHDAGNGNLSIMFNTHVVNNNSYTVFITGLNLLIGDSIPSGVQIPTYDGQFNTINTKIDSVDQALEEVKKAQNSTNNKLNSIQEETKKTNDTLNDDDTTDSTNKANEFFSGFTTDTFGLTSIITAPLSLIGSITSSTCSPLSLNIPFLSKNNKLDLPCMSSIYQENFGSFLTIYQTVTFGIVAYWVCVRIFALVKGFKNPDEDKVEVLDL